MRDARARQVAGYVSEEGVEMIERDQGRELELKVKAWASVSYRAHRWRYKRQDGR